MATLQFNSADFLDIITALRKIELAVNALSGGGGEGSNSSATLVASAGTNQATAAQLAVGRSFLTGEAGVAVPAATVGASCVLVSQASGIAINIFSKNGTSDTINGTADTYCVSQVPVYFDCFVDGAWLTNAATA